MNICMSDGVVKNIMIMPFDLKYEKEVADFVNESMHHFIDRPYKDRPDVLNINEYYINNGGLFYIALDNNSVIGTIGLENKGDIGVLKRFYVDEDYHGHGIGNNLYEVVESFIKEKTNIKTIYLICDGVLKDAHKFYYERGYIDIDEPEVDIEHFYKDSFLKKDL